MTRASKSTPPAWLSSTIEAAWAETASVPEFAAAIGRAPSTVKRWIRDGKLETVKIGVKQRIRRDAITRLLTGGASDRASA